MLRAAMAALLLAALPLATPGAGRDEAAEEVGEGLDLRLKNGGEKSTASEKVGDARSSRRTEESTGRRRELRSEAPVAIADRRRRAAPRGRLFVVLIRLRRAIDRPVQSAIEGRAECSRPAPRDPRARDAAALESDPSCHRLERASAAAVAARWRRH